MVTVLLAAERAADLISDRPGPAEQAKKEARQ
jgi:hypothetical protein